MMDGPKMRDELQDQLLGTKEQKGSWGDETAEEKNKKGSEIFISLPDPILSSQVPIQV